MSNVWQRLATRCPTIEYRYDPSIVVDARANSRVAASLPVRLTPAQVRALVGPARQEIVDVLESAGPSSVAGIAALLGRPADALYHHLRRLVAVGLVAELERRREGRHVFAVYDLRVRPIRLPYSLPVRRTDVARVVSAAQRLTWREFARALAQGTGVTEGPQRTLRGGRAKGWVTAERLARVNQLVEELMDTITAGTPGKGATPISLSFVLAPSPAGAAARGRVRTHNGRRRS
jgi:DNA-binding transcriptional ArsR family regulator